MFNDGHWRQRAVDMAMRHARPDLPVPPQSQHGEESNVFLSPGTRIVPTSSFRPHRTAPRPPDPAFAVMQEQLTAMMSGRPRRHVVSPPKDNGRSGSNHGGYGAEAQREDQVLSPMSDRDDGALLHVGSRDSSTMHNIPAAKAPLAGAARLERMTLNTGPVNQAIYREAFLKRCSEIESSIADYQHKHVRERANESVELDKAVRELEAVDFRSTEVYSRIEAQSTAMKQRLTSRLETLVQLRQDSEALFREQARTNLHVAVPRSSSTSQAQQFSLFQALLDQLKTHADVQVTGLEHLLLESFRPILERVAAVGYVADHGQRLSREPLEGVFVKLEQTVSSIHQQLNALREERIEFERRFSQMLLDAAAVHPLSQNAA